MTDANVRNLKNQWEWHDSFRDASKNMYRTTYSDCIHFREVNVENNYPSGYGGHVPTLRHDVLFKNTTLHAEIEARSHDVTRDCHPPFERQKRGQPIMSSKKRGLKFAREEVYPAPWAYCLPTTPSLTYNDSPPRLNVKKTNVEEPVAAPAETAPAENLAETQEPAFEEAAAAAPAEDTTPAEETAVAQAE